MSERKITKADYIKQCWEYITETLKGLKNLSGNIINMENRKQSYKELSDFLLLLKEMECLELVDKVFYTLENYSTKDFTGKFLGFYLTSDLVIRFEILCGYGERCNINYNEYKDILDINLERLANGSFKFDQVEITEENLALFTGTKFSGVLLENILRDTSLLNK